MTTTQTAAFKIRSTYGVGDIAKLFDCPFYDAKNMIEWNQLPVMRINLLRNPKRVGHVELLRFLRERPVFRAALDRFETAIRLDEARRAEERRA